MRHQDPRGFVGAQGVRGFYAEVSHSAESEAAVRAVAQQTWRFLESCRVTAQGPG